ncbi:MAG: hypothetical protein AB7K86_17150 [Rhodospirillales bacterium]
MTAPLPANLLGAGLGLIGLALLWQRAGFAAAGAAMAAIGAATLAAIVAAGAAAAARAPRRLAATFAHPAQRGFLCAATMGVTGLALAAPWPATAAALWWAGAAGHAALALAAASCWIAGGGRGGDLDTPAFLPVFGALFVPIGVPAGDAAVAGWYFAAAVAVGAPLFAWVMARTFDPAWTPTPAAVIAIAPWSLCVLACDAIGGAAAGWPIDAAAALAALSFMRAAALAPRLARLPFGAAWWAYTFPSTAFASAAVVYAGHAPWARVPALALALAASAVVMGVAARSVPPTVRRLRRGLG